MSDVFDLLSPLLYAAEQATSVRSVGVLDAFGCVVFAPHYQLAQSAQGIVLHSPHYGCTVNQNFEGGALQVSRTWNSLETVCQQHKAPWSEIGIRSQSLIAFRPFGAGIRFVRIHSMFDVEQFIRTVERYNCHRSVAERIAVDLVAVGERTTTVRSPLIEHWNDLQRDLKDVGIHIERTLPRLTPHSSTLTNLSDKIETLKRQFGR